MFSIGSIIIIALSCLWFRDNFNNLPTSATCKITNHTIENNRYYENLYNGYIQVTIQDIAIYMDRAINRFTPTNGDEIRKYYTGEIFIGQSSNREVFSNSMNNKYPIGNEISCYYRELAYYDIASTNQKLNEMFYCVLIIITLVISNLFLWKMFAYYFI
ncbi:MAG: hypothetical protein MUO21_06705 [Nitrososphaeraceae archaeon]|nr:hypothetical protein [Nitrososphaeraceae archaeon]